MNKYPPCDCYRKILNPADYEGVSSIEIKGDSPFTAYYVREEGKEPISYKWFPPLQAKVTPHKGKPYNWHLHYQFCPFCGVKRYTKKEKEDET